MEATTKICLWEKRAKKEGKFPVKIRVIWNREANFFPTGKDLSKEEFANLHIDKSLKKSFETVSYFLQKADKIIKDLGNDFNWLEFKQAYYNNQPEITQSSKNVVSLNIFDHITEYAKQLHSEGRISSEGTYTLTAKYLKKYLEYPKYPVLTFKTINKSFLKRFEDFYINSGELSYSSVGIYTRNIRRIFNIAIEDKKIISRDIYPFGRNGYTPPATANTKKALQLDDVGKIYDYKPADEFSNEAWSKDMWLFAYFGSGINVKDIAHLKYKDYDTVSETISFYREKSKNAKKAHLKKIVIYMTDDIKRIIDKWGRKPVIKDDFIFSILEKNLSAEEEFNKEKNAIQTINKYMKRIAEELKLSRLPTTNFARHTYATVLKRSKAVPIEMISEQLGHADVQTTQIYLDSFEDEQKREISKHLTAFKLKKKTVRKAKKELVPADN